MPSHVEAEARRHVGGGTMLNTGTGPRCVPGAVDAHERRSDLRVGRAQRRSDVALTRSRARPRCTVAPTVGLPTNPGGQVDDDVLGRLDRPRDPTIGVTLSRTGFVTVLKSIDVDALYGCPPACVNGCSGGIGGDLSVERVDAERRRRAWRSVSDRPSSSSAAPPPETSNEARQIRRTTPTSTATVDRDQQSPSQRPTDPLLVHLIVVAPATG